MMMNPAVYFFNSLKNLSHSTELLEYCNWDDDEANKMISGLVEILSSIDIDKHESLQECNAEIRKILKSKYEKNGVDILMKILENCSEQIASEIQNEC